MNGWRRPCEHGRYDAHDLVIFKCPGGSPVTAADLEGEEIYWCDQSRRSVRALLPCHHKGDEKCGWRLLIPLPDTEPAKT